MILSCVNFFVKIKDVSICWFCINTTVSGVLLVVLLDNIHLLVAFNAHAKEVSHALPEHLALDNIDQILRTNLCLVRHLHDDDTRRYSLLFLDTVGDHVVRW